MDYILEKGVTGCVIKPKTRKALSITHRWVDRNLILKNFSRKDRWGKPTISKKFGIARDDGSYVLIKADGDLLSQELDAQGCTGKIINKRVRAKFSKTPSYTMLPGKSPYDYQQKLINKVVARDKAKKTTTHLFSLQTGKGKTFINITLGSIFKGRLVAIMKSNHIDQWVNDITDDTDIDKKEIMRCNGVAALDKILKMDKDKLNTYRAIIISTSTLQRYYIRYESTYLAKRKKDKAPSPHDLFAKLKPGVVLIDEIDEIPHCHYSTLAYDIPVKRILGMSASFFNVKDKMLNKIYFRMFPEDFRLEIKLDRYVNYSTLLFHFNGYNGPIRHSYPGSDDYNHIAYEKFILSNQRLTAQYTNLIKAVIIEDYVLNISEPNQSLIIFTAGLDMAAHLEEYILQQEPFNKLKGYVYTGDIGTLEGMLDAQVAITTVSKSQSGLDKPGLITVIDTTSTAATRATVQKPGRLRKIEGKNFYIHLVNQRVHKQVNYSKEAFTLLKPRVKSIKGFIVDIPSNEDLDELYKRAAKQFEKYGE